MFSWRASRRIMGGEQMAEHVCPWWVGYLLASPIRRLLQNPERILGAYVREGMTVLDAGCAMGFFSLPLARMVGEKGRVICVDVQERMIRSLEKRAEKAGLMDRIETRVCSPTCLELMDLEGQVDFAIAFAVVHEARDPAAFLSQVHDVLAPRGRLLLAEPKGHVSAKAFDETVHAAEACGFVLTERGEIKRSISALLQKSG
jgi:2-polyprenyl-3-methyl-5-hydroxy-6-metoxy-1,4-benzoquinol methylase